MFRLRVCSASKPSFRLVGRGGARPRVVVWLRIVAWIEEVERGRRRCFPSWLAARSFRLPGMIRRRGKGAGAGPLRVAKGVGVFCRLIPGSAEHPRLLGITGVAVENNREEVASGSPVSVDGEKTRYLPGSVATIARQEQ